jgi:acyl-CoA thioester hydrolase
MPGPVFTYPHRVTYSDCTLGNHVYYGRYLEILEAARGAFFREIGFSLTQLQDQGCIFPVYECRLRYRAPARYDDALTVSLAVMEASGVRLAFDGRIQTHAGALVLEAQTFHACTGLDERPRRLPALLAEALKAWLASPAARTAPPSNAL